MNVLTGLGTHLRDKRMNSHVQWDAMDEVEAEQLYAGDDVAATIVDTLPQEALREWITLQFEDDEDLAPAVADEMDRLEARPKLLEAWRWARMYGGAGIFVHADDSLDPAEPLDLGRVRSVLSLTVLSRWELLVTTPNVDLDMASARYGQPVWYIFQPRRGGAKGSGTRIHHSRILRFDGAPLPMRLHITNQYWGDSVLNRARGAIRNYNTGHDAAATIASEFNQGVYKIKGLAGMIASGNEALVTARLQTINLARSICRAVVLDGDDDFANVGAALSGVPELIAKLESRLGVSARMPHDKLLGDSPSGLGATGDSENRIWYDYVANQREDVLHGKVRLLLELILNSRKGPTGGQEPEKWDFEFAPLWQLDDKEQAELRKVQADTDAIYLERQVVDPDEIAASRFGSGKYSTETLLDMDARQARPDPADDPPPPPAAKVPP